MKKDRNCGCQYPVYPAVSPVYPAPMYPTPMLPGGMNQMPGGMNQMPNMPQTPNMNQGNQMNIESQLNSMMTQINNLERRVSALETTVGPTNYNNSNYQMM